MSRELDSEVMGGTLDEPPKDARERVEAEWLLAREKDPAAPPPSAAVAREYEELEHLLGSMPDGPSDQSWHDEILKKATAKPVLDDGIGNGELVLKPTPRRTPWWKSAAALWAGGGLATAAAAATVLTVVTIAKKPTPADVGNLVVEIVKQGDLRGEGDKPGALDITSRRGDVRVFRKPSPTSPGYEYARCATAGDLCKLEGDKLTFHVLLEQPGEYQVVWLPRVLENTDGATMEELLRAADKQKLELAYSKDPIIR